MEYEVNLDGYNHLLIATNATMLSHLIMRTDVFSKTKRSAVMSLIRSRGNKATELRLIEIFREYGITGWRRNPKWPVILFNITLVTSD